MNILTLFELHKIHSLYTDTLQLNERRDLALHTVNPALKTCVNRRTQSMTLPRHRHNVDAREYCLYTARLLYPIY